MKRNKVVAITVGLLCLVLLTVGCPNSTQNAANAVNKYGESLSHFQDAVKKSHDMGKMTDDQYREFLKAEKVAATAGKDLDAAILVASSGGDYSQYVTLAQKSFQDLTAQLNLLDPQTRQDLTVVAQLSGDLLQNAISLIQALKSIPAKPSGGVPAAFWLIPIMGLAAAATPLSGVLQLLQAVAQLEPIAFDLLVKLAQNLKGKTTEEIVAMNESLFDKVIDTADAELKALDQTP